MLGKFIALLSYLGRSRSLRCHPLYSMTSMSPKETKSALTAPVCRPTPDRSDG